MLSRPNPILTHPIPSLSLSSGAGGERPRAGGGATAAGPLREGAARLPSARLRARHPGDTTPTPHPLG